MKAVLMLEDGKSFTGEIAPGAGQEAIGEVSFDTAVVGYQEILTDPSNAGKILTFTYPLIGNYGIAPKFNESANVWAQAAVIKEKTRIYSNWQATSSFDDFVKKNKLTVISGVDTRSLAVHLRQKGQMLGIISANCFDTKELLKKIDDYRKKEPRKFLAEVSVKKIVEVGKPRPKQKRLAILDLGMAQNLRRQLDALGVHLTFLPFNTPAQEILKLKPHGLIVSSGPEQDPDAGQVKDTLKALIGKIPILAIASGHEILSDCLGAKVVKMKLGHHGVNYPVHSPASYKGEITCQNHSYVADVESMSKIKDVKITAYNLNDRTVEEIESKKHRFIGVQYDPKSPGLSEVNPVFLRFLKMLQRSK
jgi:carbamoyl-phosphate synthase small subunit